MKVKDLFKNSSCWTKGALARDKDNRMVPPENKNATKWCLNGAVIRCYGYKKRYFKVLSKLNKAIFPLLSLSHFNDSKKFPAIKKLVNKLNI